MVHPLIRRSRIVLLALLAAGGARASAAEADPAAMALTWHAPPGCPSEARVVADVAQNLTSAGGAAMPFVAVVSVRGPADGHWQASVLFESRLTRAERQFDAESCDAIASAAALVIALWAEGGSDGSEGSNESTEPPPVVSVAPPLVIAAPEAVAPSVPAIAASPPPEPGGGDIERSRFMLALNALVDRNTMPQLPASGFEIGAGRIWTAPGWTFPSWSLRALGAASYFPMQLYNPPWNVRQAHFQLFDLSSRGCFTLGGGGFEIGPCVGAELAVMRATGEVFADSNLVWLSILASAVVSWRATPSIALFARGEVAVPTARKSFYVVDAPGPAGTWEYYRVPSYAGRGALGVELIF
jgi:hypothetical protein